MLAIEYQRRQTEAAEASAAAAAQEAAYALSKSQEAEYMELISNGKYKEADAYIDKLIEKGLSGEQSGYWLSMIPQSYWDGKDKDKFSLSNTLTDWYKGIGTFLGQFK